MSRYRVISAVVLTTLLLCVQALPAHATNPLLSGYGGPGQGNQALIGSTLIGGGSGGRGGAGGSGASSSTSSSPRYLSPSSMALPRGGAAGGTKGAAAAKGKKGAGNGAGEGRKQGSAAGTPAARARTVAAASSSRAAGRGTLGLSGADAAYIVLAFLLLALTALLTVRLSRRPGRAGGTQ